MILTSSFDLYIPEDNNTRVLFERVLSSGGLTPTLSVEVWNRFLEFESNIGDLSSIVKVERRRSAVLEKVFSFYFVSICTVLLIFLFSFFPKLFILVERI